MPSELPSSSKIEEALLPSGIRYKGPATRDLNTGTVLPNGFGQLFYPDGIAVLRCYAEVTTLLIRSKNKVSLKAFPSGFFYSELQGPDGTILEMKLFDKTGLLLCANQRVYTYKYSVGMGYMPVITSIKFSAYNHKDKGGFIYDSKDNLITSFYVGQMNVVPIAHHQYEQFGAFNPLSVYTRIQFGVLYCGSVGETCLMSGNYVNNNVEGTGEIYVLDESKFSYFNGSFQKDIQEGAGREVVHTRNSGSCREMIGQWSKGKAVGPVDYYIDNCHVIGYQFDSNGQCMSTPLLIEKPQLNCLIISQVFVDKHEIFINKNENTIQCFISGNQAHCLEKFFDDLFLFNAYDFIEVFTKHCPTPLLLEFEFELRQKGFVRAANACFTSQCGELIGIAPYQKLSVLSEKGILYFLCTISRLFQDKVNNPKFKNCIQILISLFSNSADLSQYALLSDYFPEVKAELLAIINSKNQFKAIISNEFKNKIIASCVPWIFQRIYMIYISTELVVASDWGTHSYVNELAEIGTLFQEIDALIVYSQRVKAEKSILCAMHDLDRSCFFEQLRRNQIEIEQRQHYTRTLKEYQITALLTQEEIKRKEVYVEAFLCKQLLRVYYGLLCMQKNECIQRNHLLKLYAHELSILIDDFVYEIARDYETRERKGRLHIIEQQSNEQHQSRLGFFESNERLAIQFEQSEQHEALIEQEVMQRLSIDRVQVRRTIMSQLRPIFDLFPPEVSVLIVGGTALSYALCKPLSTSQDIDVVVAVDSIQQLNLSGFRASKFVANLFTYKLPLSGLGSCIVEVIVVVTKQKGTAFIERDYLGRDFSIGALYVDVSGKLFDPSGRGIEDASSRQLCGVGMPYNMNTKIVLRALKHILLGYTPTKSYKKALMGADISKLDQNLMSWIHITIDKNMRSHWDKHLQYVQLMIEYKIFEKIFSIKEKDPQKALSEYRSISRSFSSDCVSGRPACQF